VRVKGQENTPEVSGGSVTEAPSLTPWLAPAGLSALIALFSLAYAIKKDRKAAKEKQNAEVAVARANALETRLFYKAGAVYWKIDVNDLEGRLRTECTFEGIQALPKGATLTSIPGALNFAPPESAITQYPTLIHHSFMPTELSREVKLTVLEPKKVNSCEYVLDITGSLPYGHSLSYTYEVCASSGIFMSKEEVDQNTIGAFRKEFWAHYVATPVDNLEILISFPGDYPIENFYVGVCIGKVPSDNLMYSDEIRRIEESKWFDKSSNRARLRVEKPFVGFTYLVYWNPPAKRIVDALKQSAVSSVG